MQGKSKGTFRKRASAPAYVSPNQLVLPGFKTPFEQKLTRENRWVRFAACIPWDEPVMYYDNLFASEEDRPSVNGRLSWAPPTTPKVAFFIYINGYTFQLK